jgi:SAM-dependent methyltransferase
MPFTDGFVSAKTLGTEFLAPIDVYWCANCKTTQTLHDVEVSDYYREYRYTVSDSAFARNFMEKLANTVFTRYGLQRGSAVIEIGSGDGKQLSYFQSLGARVMGFEPAVDLTGLSRAAGIPVVEGLFDADTTAEIPIDMRPAQVVLLTYTFDHLPAPASFLRAIRSILDCEDGLLIIEVHDLEKIIERRETCLFAHEHSIYLNLLTMKRLLEREGFKLISADLVPEKERRGNSLLIAAALDGSGRQADPFDRSPILAGMDNWQGYEAFGSAVEESRAKLQKYVRSRTAEGKRVAGYGAGGRGVMALALADFNDTDISYVCDRNPCFHGLFTPRTHIPIVSPEHALIDPVDELIVFSFGYLDEIRKQLDGYIGRGGRIVSLLDLL